MTSEKSETEYPFKAAIAAFGIAFLIAAITCVWLGIQWQQTAASVVSVQKSLRTLEADLDNVEQEVAAATKARDDLNAKRQPDDLGIGSAGEASARGAEGKANAFGKSANPEVSAGRSSAGVDLDSDALPVAEFQNTAKDRKSQPAATPSAAKKQDPAN